MTLLVASVVTVLVVSSLCSLTEAAIYAVRTPYISSLAESGSMAGKVLAQFKANMERPISAILIVNTAANTAGAAVAGAQARLVFGEGSLIWFSASFTLAVLFLAEILPKVAGVAYNRGIARAASIPLNAAVTLLFPLVWLTQRVSVILRHRQPPPIAPEEEVRQLAVLSANEGSILKFESELVKNVLGLDQIRAKDIMTPRTVVFSLSSGDTVRDVAPKVAEEKYARIPVFAADDPEDWRGVVLRADILVCLANDEFDRSVGSLAKPIAFVPEAMPAHILLGEFIRKQQHLLGVVDEYGGVVGIVCLEDVLESLIGQEIVDETDVVVDLQEVARRRGRAQMSEPDTREGKRDDDR